VPETVDVTVQTALCTSAPDTADQFTFTPAGALPTVDALSTPGGSIAGGQLVIITGTNFTDVTGVSFGGVAASDFSIDSPTTIVAVAPPQAASAPGSITEDVTVTTTAGTSTASAADQYTVTAAPPVITGLSEASAFTTGGDVFTISGTGLTGATAVYFGTTAASVFSVTSDGAITVTAPAIVGQVSNLPETVDVTVVTPIGTSAPVAADQFTFTPAGALPTITSLDTPTASSAGGTAITVTGTNFTDVTAVSFVVPPSGGSPATSIAATSYQVISPTTLVAVAPVEAAGTTVDLIVTTTAGASAVSSADQVTFQVPLPTITSVSVAGQSTPGGALAGGDTVTINGTNLAGATSVMFGNTPAGSFTVNADGTITAVSPAEAAGVVDIRVVTPYGATAAGSADQFTFANPNPSGGSGGGGNNGSGSGSGPGNGAGTPPSYNATYTGPSIPGFLAPNPPEPPYLDLSETETYKVVDWPNGQPGGNAPPDFGGYSPVGTGIAASGLLTQFVIPPMDPLANVPRLNPTYTYNSSGWTMTDGGTIVYRATMNQTFDNGATFVEKWSDTITFNVVQSGTFNDFVQPSLYVFRQDKIVLDQKFTAADGTGYHKIDQSTNKATYNHVGPSNGNETYMLDNVNNDNYDMQQNGIGPLGTAAGITVHNDDSGYSGSHTHTDITIDHGVTTVNGNSTSSGYDQYEHTNIGSTATASDDDILGGSDWWQHSDKNDFTQYTDGTTTASNVVVVQGGGNDLFFNNDFLASTTVSSDQTGPTTLVDNRQTDDFGNDKYLTYVTGTASRALDGSVTSFDIRNNSDSGNDDDNVANYGTVDSVATYADGSVVTAHDDFNDPNDDKTDYSDSEQEAPGLTSATAGEGDVIQNNDHEKDNFDTRDNERVQLSYVAPAGAQTSVTINELVTDDGFLKDGGFDIDMESLPTLTTSENDDVIFDQWANEQDTAHADGQTVVRTLGYVARGDYVDSTETLTNHDIQNTNDNIDDPGTDDSTPSNDTEQDTETEKSEVQGNLTLGDVLDATEIVTGSDGSIIKTTIHDRGSDTILTDEKDKNGDQHSINPGTPPNPATQTPGTGETVNDQPSFDDKATLVDKSTGNSTVTTNIWQPVAGGVLSSVSSLITSGNDTYTDNAGDKGGGNITGPDLPDVAPTSDSESDTSFDDITDYFKGNSLVQESSRLTLTDAGTGVVTKLGTGDTIQDQSSNQSGENVNEKESSGYGGPTPSSETDDVTETDWLFGSDKTQSNGSLNLSIVGMPVAGESENLNQTISLTGNDQSQENSNGGGEDDSYHSAGSGANPSPVYTEDVSGNETVKDFDFGNQTVSTLGNSTISMTDPTTNITTSDTVLDKGSLGVGYQGNATLTDKQTDDVSYSAPETEEEDLTDDDQMKEVINGGDKSTETIGINGTTADGTTIHSTEIINDKSQINGNTTDGDTGGETIVGQVSNLPGSDVASNTGKSSDDIRTGDLKTDNLVSTFSYIDPTTGLSTSINITDNSTDLENDEEIDSAKDVEGESLATSNSAAGMPTDDYTFDNKLIESGRSTDAPTIIINTQGTDAQGEQINSQETLGLTGNATSSVNDEDIGEETVGINEPGGIITDTPTETDTETVDADVQSHATLIDTIIGTIVAVDATTGIKTTTTDNISISGGDDEHDHEDETDARVAGVSDNDTITQTDTDPLTLVWNNSEGVTYTNPDGSAASPPTNETDNGNSTTSMSVASSKDANGNTTITSASAQTVTDNSSNQNGTTTTTTTTPADTNLVSQFTSSAVTSDQNKGRGSASGDAQQTKDREEEDVVGAALKIGENWTVVKKTNGGQGTSGSGGNNQNGQDSGNNGVSNGSTPTNTPNTSGSGGAWYSSAWGGVKSAVTRVDQFYGQVWTFGLTATWPSKETASGIGILKGALTGAENGSVLVWDSLTLGSIDSLHKDANAIKRDAALANDWFGKTLNYGGIYSAKVGAGAVQALAVVGVFYGGGVVLVYFVPEAAGTLTVAGHVAQPVIMVMSADAAYNNGVAAYYDYQNGDLIEMTDHAADGTLWAAFTADSAIGTVKSFNAASSSGGRLGSNDTRSQILDIMKELKSREWTVTNGGEVLGEEYIPGPNGARRGSAYPDITATKNRRILRINTVDTLADDVTPTLREARNAAKIRRLKPGDHLLLVPKTNAVPGISAPYLSISPWYWVNAPALPGSPYPDEDFSGSRTSP